MQSNNSASADADSPNPRAPLDSEIDKIFQPLLNNPSLTLTTVYWNDAKRQIQELISQARIDENKQALSDFEPNYLIINSKYDHLTATGLASHHELSERYRYHKLRISELKKEKK